MAAKRRYWGRADAPKNTKVAPKPPRKKTLTIPALAELLGLIATGRISGNAGKEIFDLMRQGDSRSPSKLMADLDLGQISDPEVIAVLCRQVLAEHAGQTAAYRAGKTGLLDYLVGRVLAESGGKANPRLVSNTLRMLLADRG